MLKKLTIQNYALIKELELSFSDGLNIITGETGAGKSIIIGALGLILGNRADVNVLNAKDEKCVVEAIFDFQNEQIKAFLKSNEIDKEDILLIRRQINPQGKSRAFVNDTPVKLPVLRELSGLLIDVNSQFQTFSLNDTSSQLRLLDDFAGVSENLVKYQKLYTEYNSLNRKLISIEDRERKAKIEQDFLQFQFNELEQANLIPGEQIRIEEELELLNHAEEIKKCLYEVDSLLQSEDDGSLEKVSSSLNSLQTISLYNDNYKQLFTRLNEVYIELQDIAQEVDSIKNNVEFDPLRLDELGNRIDLLNRLQQKHIKKSDIELISLKDHIENQLLSFSQIEEDKSHIHKKIAIIFDKLIIQADEIHELRWQVINDVQKQVENNLSSLGMNSARFVIDLDKQNKLTNTGIDSVNFLFSANKGIEVGAISKIASGGELSRLMLTLKYVLTSKKLLSTIIFDEIDTGVSGDIANKVGDMMKLMGKKMQIIAITHLPQIAGKAKSHYKVFKKELNQRTYSSIRLLNNDERVEELSIMISGNKKSKAATATARELMN
ncbi:MAG: DNA repair protein RecN [Bacteroidales bacterium]|nr:DNA repair protein RecN [Bacteroidales bacterium]